MKPVSLVLAISVLLFGCASTGDVLFDSLYSRSTSAVKDIRGSYTVERFLLSREGTMSVNRYIITVDRLDTPDGSFYTIVAIYDGQGWVFAEEFFLKTDSNLYRFTDDDPSHVIVSGTRVKETLRAELTDSQVADILATDHIELQFKDLLEVPPEGVAKLKEFLMIGGY